MEKRRFKIKKKHVIIIAVVLAVLLLAVFVPFIATRYSRATTYVPFTGRVFSLDSEELTAVRFQSGKTGGIIEYTGRGEIREVADYLNSFRYRSWKPQLNIGAGFSYAVTFYFDDGESAWYMFHSFSDSTMVYVNGVWFYGEAGYFNRFTNALDSLPPGESELTPTPIPASDGNLLIMTPPPATNPDIE